MFQAIADIQMRDHIFKQIEIGEPQPTEEDADAYISNFTYKMTAARRDNTFCMWFNQLIDPTSVMHMNCYVRKIHAN